MESSRKIFRKIVLSIVTDTCNEMRVLCRKQLLENSNSLSRLTRESGNGMKGDEKMIGTHGLRVQVTLLPKIVGDQSLRFDRLA